VRANPLASRRQILKKRANTEEGCPAAQKDSKEDTNAEDIKSEQGREKESDHVD